MKLHFGPLFASIRRLVVCLATLSLTTGALAQGSAVGTISGRLTDPDNLTLPGVAVTLTSPALPGPRTTTSSAKGEYSFDSLPPGDYALSFELQGFSPARRQVVVKASKEPVILSLKMELAAMTEVVNVVGSQIEGAKVTASLPVSVISVEQIQAVTAGSGDELFRTLPQAGNVTFNSNFIPTSSNSARGDVNSISLRNLGAGNTLVLLNGRRTVVHPTTQAESLVPVFTYNTNAIPVAGLKRVEVLRDGASAIYGADAVAGVINTVLENHYTGGSVEAQFGPSEGTSKREGRLTGIYGRGILKDRGHFTIFGSAERRSALLDSDQDFTRYADKRPLFAGTEFENATSLDGRSVTSAWGVFQVLSTTSAIRSNNVAVTGATGLFHIAPQGNPTCGVVLSPGLCLDSGAQNVTNDRNLRLESASFKTSTIPKVARYNLFSTFTYNFSDNVNFFSELGYYNADSHGTTTSPGVSTATTVTIPATGYYNPFGAAVLPNGQPNPNRLPGLSIPASGLPVQINTYGLVDFGATPVTVKNEQFRLLGGLKGKARGFSWESAMLYSRATVDDQSFAVSATKLQQALSLTTPDAYNPFNGGTLTDPSYGDATPSSASAIAAIGVPILRASKTALALWDLKISRPDLFSIPGGGVGLAMGVEARHEDYRDNRDSRIDGTSGYTDAVTGVSFPSDILGTSTSPDVAGKRTVASGYAELAVPLVSPEMKFPLINRLDIQLAGRAEHYSDFGNVAKPKVGGALDIVPGLRLRGSWSQGFRAPNLEQINVTQVSRSNNRQDYIYCEADLRARRITSFNACSRSRATQAIRSGNPNLEPETSDSLSYGVVLEPRFIPDRLGRLTLTADVWRINQKGIIGVFGEGNAVILDYFLRVTGSSNPKVHRAAPSPDDIAAFAGTGIEPVGVVTSVDDQYVNQLPQQAKGTDVGAIYRLNTERFGNFDLNVDVSYLHTLYQSPSPAIQTLLDARAAGKINAGTVITGASELVGQNGTPAWRGSASFNWSRGRLSANWFSNYIGKFYSTGLTYAAGGFYDVPATTFHNLSFAYEFRGSGLTGLRLRAGVRNLLNTTPPLSPGGYVAAAYNPDPRYWFVSVRKTF
ncbi:MAG: TonB-dependent receptor [Vicinamibacteria bacterium]|nr:TonB-dependent receptor [Vicinamibacteria bacterium]